MIRPSLLASNADRLLDAARDGMTRVTPAEAWIEDGLPLGNGPADVRR